MKQQNWTLQLPETIRAAMSRPFHGVNLILVFLPLNVFTHNVVSLQ